MGAVIQALTGSTNRDEVSVMAKQATVKVVAAMQWPKATKV